jgi:EAL and modified HD-GYP domain-containing signal transduction protein
LSADAEARDIEITLKQDPHLSYQLLKLVNSVAFSLSSKISSFTQAIALLGRRQLQRWLQLLLYARPKGEGDAASPLMPRAALRAGLMENLARAAGGSKDMQDKAFMVGMFSLVEPLIGLPAAEVIKPLNLNEDVALAITEHQGQLGAWLAAIETAEAGLPDQTRAALAAAAISLATWATEQAGACRWAVQISREA